MKRIKRPHSHIQLTKPEIRSRRYFSVGFHPEYKNVFKTAKHSLITSLMKEIQLYSHTDCAIEDAGHLESWTRMSKGKNEVTGKVWHKGRVCHLQLAQPTPVVRPIGPDSITCVKDRLETFLSLQVLLHSHRPSSPLRRCMMIQDCATQVHSQTTRNMTHR